MLLIPSEDLALLFLSMENLAFTLHKGAGFKSLELKAAHKAQCADSFNAVLTQFLYSRKLIFIRQHPSLKHQAIFGSVLSKLIEFVHMEKEKLWNEAGENINHRVFLFLRM